MTDRPRVIIALPDAAESAAVADWLLADGFEPVARSIPERAAEEMRARPFALLVADAAFLYRRLHVQCRLRNALTPIILVGPASASQGVTSGQTMFLARPLDRAVLSCFVTMAILDSRPTRRSIRKPVVCIDAIVNGVPSHLLDVSPEGLRLEIPRDTRASLPPYFTVRVPLVGVALTVQRMWGHAASDARTFWYGGALSQNRPVVAQAWRSFVDRLPVTTQTGPASGPSEARARG